MRELTRIIIETINKISKASNWLKITCFYVIILVMLRKNEYNNQRQKGGSMLEKYKKETKR